MAVGGIVNINGKLTGAFCTGIGTTTSGEELGIVKENVEETVYILFLAVTLIVCRPLSTPAGVPLNLRVAGVKVSQAGRGVSSKLVAE